jgi:GNAT superfamily N-acetyltransferase
VANLDADLAQRDGEDHVFYDQFNKIGNIPYAMVAFDANVAVGCGALKQFDKERLEVKRMYVSPDNRGKGIATLLLGALEAWAKELGYEKCILETGKKQPEAIALYEKNGYVRVSNYGQYKGIENSVCFEKKL